MMMMMCVGPILMRHTLVGDVLACCWQSNSYFREFCLYVSLRKPSV